MWTAIRRASSALARGDTDRLEDKLAHPCGIALPRLGDFNYLFGDPFSDRVGPVCQLQYAPAVLVGRHHWADLLRREGRLLQ